MKKPLPILLLSICVLSLAGCAPATFGDNSKPVSVSQSFREQGVWFKLDPYSESGEESKHITKDQSIEDIFLFDGSGKVRVISGKFYKYDIGDVSKNTPRYSYETLIGQADKADLYDFKFEKKYWLDSLDQEIQKLSKLDPGSTNIIKGIGDWYIYTTATAGEKISYLRTLEHEIQELKFSPGGASPFKIFAETNSTGTKIVSETLSFKHKSQFYCSGFSAESFDPSDDEEMKYYKKCLKEVREYREGKLVERQTISLKPKYAANQIYDSYFSGYAITFHNQWLEDTDYANLLVLTSGKNTGFKFDSPDSDYVFVDK